MNKHLKKAVSYNMRRGLDTARLEPKEFYDKGIAGVRIRDGRAHVVYSFNRLVALHIRHDGISAEEAIEWLDFNTARAIPYMRGPKIVEPILTDLK